MRLCIYCVTFLLGGCNSAQQELLVGWTFTDGKYSELLHNTFGSDAVRSGTAFYILANAWADVEPNGLLLTDRRARYVSLENGIIRVMDESIESCPKLEEPMSDFAYYLAELGPLIAGQISYPNPSYLDGPDFVLEIHGREANVVIDPKGFSANFPLVVAALEVERVLDECRTTHGSS